MKIWNEFDGCLWNFTIRNFKNSVENPKKKESIAYQIAERLDGEWTFLDEGWFKCIQELKTIGIDDFQTNICDVGHVRSEF